MIVAVCSDVHDNIWALERALPMMEDAEQILFCGDFCAPFTLVQLAEGADGRPLHVVFGNNDGDRHLLTQNAARFASVSLYGEFAEFDLDGRQVAINHYPAIAHRLADGDAYDFVFYGHDHVAHDEKKGDTLLLNPGEIMGRLGKPTFSLVDTAKQTARQIAVD